MPLIEDIVITECTSVTFAHLSATSEELSAHKLLWRVCSTDLFFLILHVFVLLKGF